MTNSNAQTEPFEPTHSRIKQFFIRDLWTTDLERLDPLRQWGYRVLRLLTVAVWEFQEGVLSLRAMSLVYTTILSLVPFLALTFSVLKAFGVHQQMEPLLAQALEPLGPKGSEVTAQIIEFVNNIQVGVLGILGIALLFYTTISRLEKVESAFNAIWRVRRHRTFARKFSDYLSVVLVGPVLVFSGFALMASAQSHWLVQRALEIDPLGSLFVLMARLMPFVLVCAAFTFLYTFIPHTKVHLASAIVGGVTAGILWNVAGTAFTAFVATSVRTAAVYSSFAIMVVFLIWVYVGWLILLSGAQVAYFHQNPNAYISGIIHRGNTPLFQEWLALSTLVEISKRLLSEGQLWTLSELATALRVPGSTLEHWIDEFVRRGILARTSEPEGIALARAPEHIKTIEILTIIRDPESLGLGQGRTTNNDVVAAVLNQRDQGGWQAIEGHTLRSLAERALLPSDGATKGTP